MAARCDNGFHDTGILLLRIAHIDHQSVVISHDVAQPQPLYRSCDRRSNLLKLNFRLPSLERLHQLFRRPFSHEFCIQYPDSITDTLCLFEIVRVEKDRPLLAFEFEDEVAHRFLKLRIQVSSRLI